MRTRRSPSSRGGAGLASIARVALGRIPHGSLPVELRRAVRPLTVRLRFADVRAEDVLIASYPRSGSTWLRFLLTELAMEMPAEWPLVNAVIPDAGRHAEAPAIVPGGGRLIKTHDRFHGACRRAVYLVRDIRDVILSEYRWELRDGVDRTLDEHIDLALRDRLPTNLFGSWRDHVMFWLDSAPARRGDLLLLKFEEFRQDPHGELRKILAFLGIDATDAAIEAAIRNSSVEKMRERESRAVNAGISAGDPRYPWIGQGAVMGWRSKLTPDQGRRLETRMGDALTRLGYPIQAEPDAAG